MKKIAIILACLATMQMANAQVKSVSAAKSALDAAEAVANNPKKATKVATWLKLGECYVEAHTAPLGNGWVGANKQDLQLVMGGVKPSSTEEVTLNGQAYSKEVYPSCNYYFRDGVLSIIEPTQEVVPDALDGALKAYSKAFEIDTKGTKTADIVTGLKNVSQKYAESAYSSYTKGDYKTASVMFEKAGIASATKPCDAVDTNSFYNAGLTSWISGDNERAKVFFNKCIKEYKYEGNDGEVYAKLADIYNKENDKKAMKDVLEDGFKSFPQSQSILIGLINYYLSNNEDTGRLFELIGEAKKNEPGNASLYYVEGNVNKELGKIDEAIAAYEKCAEIDPNYEFGYVGEGILFYNQAIEFQEKASNEMDDKKWEALAAQFEKSLKGCIAPFEKAFNMTKDNALKVNVAEYLKNATYRFIEEDANYKLAYEKYTKYVEENK